MSELGKGRRNVRRGKEKPDRCTVYFGNLTKQRIIGRRKPGVNSSTPERRDVAVCPVVLIREKRYDYFIELID